MLGLPLPRLAIQRRRRADQRPGAHAADGNRAGGRERRRRPTTGLGTTGSNRTIRSLPSEANIIPPVVIPARAGIHLADERITGEMDSGFRRNDAATRRSELIPDRLLNGLCASQRRAVLAP